MRAIPRYVQQGKGRMGRLVTTVRVTVAIPFASPALYVYSDTSEEGCDLAVTAGHSPCFQLA